MPYEAALHAVMWLGHSDPERPVLLAPSRTGMLQVSFESAPGVAVGLLLLFDAVGPGPRVVTAGSLAAEILAGAVMSPRGDGLALVGERLVDTVGTPPQAPSERGPEVRVIEIGAAAFTDLACQAVEVAQGSDLLPVIGLDQKGRERSVDVPVSLLASVAAVRPFGFDSDDTDGEAVYVKQEPHAVGVFGDKATVRALRPATH
jgi:hypothetical protein